MKIKYCGKEDNGLPYVQITLEDNIYTKSEEGESLYYLGYGDADCLVRKVFFSGYSHLTPGMVKKELIKQSKCKLKDLYESKTPEINGSEKDALKRVEYLFFNFDFDSFEKIRKVLSSHKKDDIIEAYKKDLGGDNLIIGSKETIKHPNHYQGLNGMEVIEVIDNFELNFNTGNVIKYVLRAGKKEKNKKIEDLRKAIQYLEFEINKEINK